MAVVAIYSVKGGVGKTTCAVNLAWASAVRSAHRTLLWDFDPQGGSAFLLGCGEAGAAKVARAIEKGEMPEGVARATAHPLLDLLPPDSADDDLAGLLGRIGKKRRLAKLLHRLENDYPRVVLDCPPVRNALSDQIIRAADLIVVPLTASPLAARALDRVLADLSDNHGHHAPVLPVFAMYDGRRKLHVEAHQAHPDWPRIPMSSLVERMGLYHRAILDFAATSPAARAYAALWDGIERKIARVDRGRKGKGKARKMPRIPAPRAGDRAG